MKKDFFLIKHQFEKARRGTIITSHGEIETPAYVFAATAGSVRGLSSEELLELKVQVVISNTYHLHLSPGEDIVSKHKGIHSFMNWSGPIMTDSGGFQVFSLGKGRKYGVGKIGAKPTDKPAAKDISYTKVTEEGVFFRSHKSGEKKFIGPKESMEIQSKLGADMIFAFDECTSPFDTYAQVKKALETTNKWQKIALDKYNKKQKLFGIIQGGTHQDLRRLSAKFVADNKFDGVGIGGVLGADKKEMGTILSWINDELKHDSRPRHLLGMGDVDDVILGAEQGVDLFDCVHPTRLARRGTVFITPPNGNPKNKWRYHITRSENKDKLEPLDRNCRCKICKTYTRSYIRHLYMNNELNAFRFMSYHNVNFFQQLMKEVRRAIETHRLSLLKRKWLQ